MSDKKNKTSVDPDFDVNAYRRELVQTLAQEVFNIIYREGAVHGEDFVNDVKLNFLASFIATSVHSSLKPTGAQMTKEEEYKATLARYQETKQLIEAAVGQGFTGGFQAFNPETCPDYQCDITCIDAGYDDGKRH